MTCTIEKVLTDARMLVNRLKEHDNSAETLIEQAQTLQKRVDAMKQYNDDLNELNEAARHRPRNSLIINLLQENTQIRDLQQENKELRILLEEHQSAIEFIMTKYRKQIIQLMLASKLDNQALYAKNQSLDLQEKIDKICEMAVVMQQSINIDDKGIAREKQLISQLKLENNTLREILHIATTNNNLCQKDSKDIHTQTEINESDDETTPFNLETSMLSFKEMSIGSAGSLNKFDSNENLSLEKINSPAKVKIISSDENSTIDTNGFISESHQTFFPND